MKITAYAVLLLFVCLAGASAEKPSASRPYVLRGVQEPLSPQDISAAFDVLGLRIARFACSTPEEGKVLISVRRYLHSAEDKVLHEQSIPVSAGQQQLTLFTCEENQSLSFTLQMGAAAHPGTPSASKAIGPKRGGA